MLFPTQSIKSALSPSNIRGSKIEFPVSSGLVISKCAELLDAGSVLKVGEKADCTFTPGQFNVFLDTPHQLHVIDASRFLYFQQVSPDSYTLLESPVLDYKLVHQGAVGVRIYDSDHYKFNYFRYSRYLPHRFDIYPRIYFSASAYPIAYQTRPEPYQWDILVDIFVLEII